MKHTVSANLIAATVALGALPAAARVPAGLGPDTIADLAAQSAPAVVNIDTVERRRNPMMELDPWFHGFFGEKGQRMPGFFESKGVGSGFVIDSEGLVLTNWHVVHNANRIIVTFPDGKRYPGRIAGRDPVTDIGLIRISATHLPTLPIAGDDKLRVGDWVVAIGSPLGLSTTVTAGIVSATNRGLAINERIPFIQTDAPINPGNSGGPLLDLQGRVVGITTAVARNTTGIGFAIPAETVRWVLPQLLASGKVARAWLGVVLDEVSEETELASDRSAGVVVKSVAEDSPAAKAGLRPDDLILAIDGHPLRDPGELIRSLSFHHAGDTIRLLIARAGKRETVDVSLAPMPEKLMSDPTGDG